MRIVAHSMGGLVVRAMIAARPDLWDRMCERDGARLVMLGTPNRGSHDIVEALLGTSATVQQLALLDLTRDWPEIVGIVAKFPGVLELLPNDGRYFEVIRVASVPETSRRIGRSQQSAARCRASDARKHRRAPVAVSALGSRALRGRDVASHRDRRRDRRRPRRAGVHNGR